MGSRAEIGEVALLLAGEQARVEPEALAELGDERLAVDGITDGARGDRHDPLRAHLLVASLVAGDDGADVIDCVRADHPGVVDAAAHVRHRGPALDLAHGRALDVGDQQAGGVGADVDHRNPHRVRVPHSPVTRGHPSDERVAARLPQLTKSAESEQPVRGLPGRRRPG